MNPDVAEVLPNKRVEPTRLGSLVDNSVAGARLTRLPFVRPVQGHGREVKLNSTFRKIATAFAVEFDDLAKEIEHAQLSGESREHALVALLRKYLPQRVGVDRGLVIDAHGDVSRQQDVVIFDRTVGTVFEVNGVKYYPCESVIAVGEVKAHIESSDNMRDALEKIHSVKVLDRSNSGTNRLITGPGISLTPLPFEPAKNHRDQIFGFIFTSASLGRDTLVGLHQEFNRTHDRRLWPNVVCVFKRVLISYECTGRLYPSAMDATSLYCTKESEVPDLLLLFYCILASFVDEAHVARPSYFAYAAIAKTDATCHQLAGGTEAV